MISARGSFNNRPLLVLGLSAENIRRLLDDDPILLDGQRYGIDLPLYVMLIAGEDEEAMREQLEAQGAIRPQTVVKDLREAE